MIPTELSRYCAALVPELLAPEVIEDLFFREEGMLDDVLLAVVLVLLVAHAEALLPVA